MVNSVGGFREVSSFKDLKCWAEPPIAEDEWEIDVFDFDQCLAQAKPTFMDEHFYKFLVEFNQQEGKTGRERFGHYTWTTAVRNKITYETCEKTARVNKLFNRLSARGAAVVINTSRGEGMREGTIKHLKDSGLALTVESVIFRMFQSEKKNEALMRWMKTQPKWETARTIRIRFIDDDLKNCGEIALTDEDIRRESQGTKQASVECVHYTGALPNPNLTDEQKERLIVQLNAYQHNQDIPYSYEENDVTTAMQELEVKKVDGKIDSYALFLKVREVAKSKGFVF